MLLLPREQRPASYQLFCRILSESPGQSQIWSSNFYRTESRCGITAGKSLWGTGTWQDLREQFLLVSRCLSLLLFPDPGRKQYPTILCGGHFPRSCEDSSAWSLPRAGSGRSRVQCFPHSGSGVDEGYKQRLARKESKAYM